MRSFNPALCIILAACTNPYPVDVPKPDYSKNIDSNKDYDTLVEKVHNYRESLDKKTHELISQKYAITDFGYLGSVVSVIAAASGALTTALYGGGVAVGGNVAAQHYSYDEQIRNYNEARKKVQCVFRKLNERTVNERSLIMGDTNNDIAMVLRPAINSALDDIYFDLENKQSSVDLKSPDLKLLANAFDKQKDSSQKLYNFNLGPSPTDDEANKAKNSESRLILSENIQASISICKVFGDAPQQN